MHRPTLLVAAPIIIPASNPNPAPFVILDSFIIQIEKDFDTLSNDPHKLAKRLEALQKRILMLMSASAIQRYEHFIETYPDIVQRIPQRMIASYLGITPEALSTLRRKLIKK